MSSGEGVDDSYLVIGNQCKGIRAPGSSQTIRRSLAKRRNDHRPTPSDETTNP